MDNKFKIIRDDFIESAGRTTQGFGLGRIIGQIYALLYFSIDPLSLDDMADELKVSKGSISTNVRELEKWGAVRKVWIRGNRKDFYEAETDFVKIVKTGIIPFFQRKLNSSIVTINESKKILEYNPPKNMGENGKTACFYAERLKLIEQVQKKFSLLFKFSGI